MVFANFKSDGIGKSEPMLYSGDRNSKDNGAIIDLLFEGLSILERGMRGLGKNIESESGMIDILAVDMVGRVVIVEVEKKEKKEDILFKSIDHFDWALTNLRDLEVRFKGYNIDPTLAPRIIILAPSYSQKFIKRASYLNPTFIDIYEYQIKENLGVKKVYFRPFSFINHKRWIVDLRTKSLDDHLNYLEDDNLREVLKNFIVEVQSLRNDCTIDTSRGYISFRNKSNKSILNIYVLKEYFWINFTTKKWDGHMIKSKNDITSLRGEIFQAIRKEY